MEISLDINVDEIVDAVKYELDIENLVRDAVSDEIGDVEQRIEDAIDAADLVAQVESEIRALVEEETADLESRIEAIESALGDIASAAGQF